MGVSTATVDQSVGVFSIVNALFPPSPPESQKSRIYGDFWLFLLPVLSNTKDDKILWNTVKYSPMAPAVAPAKNKIKTGENKKALAGFLIMSALGHMQLCLGASSPVL